MGCLLFPKCRRWLNSSFQNQNLWTILGKLFSPQPVLELGFLDLNFCCWNHYNFFSVFHVIWANFDIPIPLFWGCFWVDCNLNLLEFRLKLSVMELGVFFYEQRLDSEICILSVEIHYNFTVLIWASFDLLFQYLRIFLCGLCLFFLKKKLNWNLMRVRFHSRQHDSNSKPLVLSGRL